MKHISLIHLNLRGEGDGLEGVSQGLHGFKLC